jgi:alcohol dehydrogenase
MGFKVVAIGRGADLAADTIELGAHVYIDTDQTEPAALLQSMGGAVAIITTVGSGALVSSLVSGLAPAGCMVVLAPGKDPLALPMGLLVGGERSIVGSITGSPFENEKALSFSVLTQTLPMIETMPLEDANIAYQKLKSGQVKFRMVLTVN